MQLFYASRDGQARRIADRIAARVAAFGMAVTPQDLADANRVAVDPSAFVVVIAAVRYGYHLPEALRFLKAFRALKTPPPLVFLSVNLTARKPGKQTPEGNAYLRKVLLKHGLKPVLARAIAGRLDYPRYTRFDRFMIRLIMRMTGGPTDPKAIVEFTDWDQVDALADQIAQLPGESAAAITSAVS